MVDNVLDKVEENITEKFKPKDSDEQEMLFTIDFENSESEILKNDDLDSEEMIQAIVSKNTLMDQERIFLKEYASQIVKYKCYKDIEEEVSKNLINIINHIFEYGFKAKYVGDDNPYQS